jgi:hypothetical protein
MFQVGQKVLWGRKKAVILSINNQKAFIKIISPGATQGDKLTSFLGDLKQIPEPLQMSQKPIGPIDCPECGLNWPNYRGGVECPSCSHKEWFSFKKWLYNS